MKKNFGFISANQAKPKNSKFNFVAAPGQEKQESPDHFKSGDWTDYINFAEDFESEEARTASQVPQGIAEGTIPGIIAGVWQLLSQGEVLDPEELDRIKAISEREGIPFDEEKYMEAAQQALGTVPTVGNIGRHLEEQTGAKLEPKSRLEKGLRFFSAATTAAPKDFTFRGMNTKFPKPVLGAGVEATREGLTEIGFPEPFADLLSFGILKPTTEGAGKFDIIAGKKTKPSGLVERRFENITSPTEISPSRHAKITSKLENDFRGISNRIVESSPVGETYKTLKENPTFKAESAEAFGEVEALAGEINDRFTAESLQKSMLSKAKKKHGVGIIPGEYLESYNEFMLDRVNKLQGREITPSDLVNQYRQNNKELGRLYESGKSGSYNDAKKDAMLDFNRAIADVIQEKYPDTEFSNLFKETNSQWAKIADAENIDKFLDGLFDGKIKYEKGKDFFEQKGVSKSFERAFGKEGYSEFKQLMKDLMSSQNAYKMLKVAEGKGYFDMAKTAMAYVIHPKAGALQFGYNTIKELYKATLDKPRLAFTWNRAVKDLKRGNFEAAEKEFAELDKEIKTVNEETIDITPEKPAEATKQAPLPKQEQKLLEKKPTEKVEEGREFRDRFMEQKTGNEPRDFEKKGLPEKKIQKPEKPKLLEEPKFESGYSEAIEETPQLSSRGQPKLIEYSPKEKPTIKERSENIAKNALNDAILGEKISRPEKDLLKNIEVSLLQTRQKGQQFHGTGKPIAKLSDDIQYNSSTQNIYGAGFYTTDALDIADGYSKAKFSKQPTVYKVTEKTPQKIYDAEQPFDEFKNLWDYKQRNHFEYVKEKYKNKEDVYFKKYKGSFDEYNKNSDYLLDDIIYNENPKSVRDLYDKIRERAFDENMLANELQEYFDEIQNVLEDQGFEGISHKGGLLTSNPEHNVKIYWKPQNLEIQKFSYPKEFKKISKITKPSS